MHDAEELIRCAKCGGEIGYYVQVGNRVHVRVGSLICWSMDGACYFCGMEYHYRVSDKMLEHLLERCRRQEIAE